MVTEAMNHYRPSDLRIVDSYRCDANGNRIVKHRARSKWRFIWAVNLIVWGWLFALYLMGK